MRLKSLRLSKGLRQQDIADFLDVGLSKIQRIENGLNELKMSEIIKLADFFEVSTDYLLEYSDRTLEEDRRLIAMVRMLEKNLFEKE
jgi:transcriptional regulator with XRE-family HTH domain